MNKKIDFGQVSKWLFFALLSVASFILTFFWNALLGAIGYSTEVPEATDVNHANHDIYWGDHYKDR